jgi:hypothetical protein
VSRFPGYIDVFHFFRAKKNLPSCQAPAPGPAGAHKTLKSIEISYPTNDKFQIQLKPEHITGFRA